LTESGSSSRATAPVVPIEPIRIGSDAPGDPEQRSGQGGLAFGPAAVADLDLVRFAIGAAVDQSQVEAADQAEQIRMIAVHQLGAFVESEIGGEDTVHAACPAAGRRARFIKRGLDAAGAQRVERGQAGEPLPTMATQRR
jgi:hypothetical protein